MCRMRAIIFFQCLLIFFMNSQFSFSAEEAPLENEPCCRVRSLLGNDRDEARVERGLSEAIRENNLHKVAY